MTPEIEYEPEKKEITERTYRRKMMNTKKKLVDGVYAGHYPPDVAGPMIAQIDDAFGILSEAKGNDLKITFWEYENGKLDYTFDEKDNY